MRPVAPSGNVMKMDKTTQNSKPRLHKFVLPQASSARSTTWVGKAWRSAKQPTVIIHPCHSTLWVYSCLFWAHWLTGGLAGLTLLTGTAWDGQGEPGRSQFTTDLPGLPNCPTPTYGGRAKPGRAPETLRRFFINKKFAKYSYGKRNV